MIGLLIDTSIVIDYLRQKDKGSTIQVNLERKFKLFASIITHTESYSGKSIWEKSQAKEILKKLLAGIQILPTTEEISEKAGEIRAKYNTSLADAIVAATAIHHKLTLATLNVNDFAKIKGLNLFKFS